MMALDKDLSGRIDFSVKHRVFSQPLHKHGSPAVNEAFRQPLM
jgi:hypothetical protein